MAAIKPEVEDKRHEVLEGISDATRRFACDFRMEADKAEQMGCMIADWIAETYGGTSLTFPKDYHFRRSKRDFEIYNKFNGRNHDDLAREYDVHTRTIRRIIARIQKQIIKRNQTDMFN